jgi:AcrR family transcriptional regulator
MSTTKNLSALSLAERHSDFTRRVILDAALGALENATVGELTVRAVAKRANLAERTVFRYFATREEFLDAIAQEVRERLALPAPPASVEALLAAPRELYVRFEARANLTRAALHSDIFPRMRETQARVRWTAVRRLVDQLAPRRPERERKIAAANVRYYLAATTWHYYRFYFGFTLDESIAAAETAIRQSLVSLGASVRPPRKAA